MSNGRLFRDEVLAGRRASWMGGLSLAQPIQTWALAGGALVATALVVGYFVAGEYTQRSRVVGQLVPDRGVSTVVAPTSGVVGRLFVDEGQEVAGGSPLVSIDVPRVTIAGTDSTAALRDGFDARRESLADQRASMATRLAAQVEGHEGQLATARRELDQIEAEIRTRREQVKVGRSILARYRRVADDKYATELQVDQQRQTVLELESQRQALERQATLARRNIVQLTQTLHELAAEKSAQEASAAWDAAVLDQERVQQEATTGLVVTAPLEGMVANRLVEPGQAVQAGQPL